MKNKRLLPIVFLSAALMVGSVAGCNSNNGGQKSSQPSSGEQNQYAVAIANKEELQAKWFIGDVARSITATLTPEANALEQLAAGNLTVTSSAPTIVSVSGLGLSAQAAGKATITVDYHGATDSVEVEVKENSAKARYGTAHEGTEADPFSNEDALIVAAHPDYKEAQTDFYVRGEVASFYNCPGERSDGMVAYYLKPAQAGGAQFEIYKCFGKDKDGKDVKLTDDDIWVGGTATAHGKFTLYQGQYETSAATFVSCTGNKPAARQTVSNKSFAEIITMASAYPDGGNSWDYYKFEGYVTSKSGNNFFLTAAKEEALTPGKSDAKHGNADIVGTNAIELYDAGKVEALTAKLLQNAKVEITMVVKNYHGTIQNCFALKDADVVVKEAGQKWNVPEPTVETKTLAEFIALENKKDKAYNVTAQIKNFKSNATKDDFGNMVLKDGDKELIIYGATATATALAWDNAAAYAFTNPKDFQTNTTTQALAVGNTITMKLIRNDYTDKNTGKVTIEGVGVVTNVVAVATTAIALKASEEVVAGKTVLLTATRTPENSNTPCEWSSSDETVATVAGGLVTGVAAGTATITAKISDTIKAQCLVTVTAPASNSYKLDGTDTTQGTNGYATESEVTQNGVSWKVTANTTINPWRIGGKSLTNQDRPLYSTSALAHDVNKIEIEFGTAANVTVNSINVGVYSTAAKAAAGGQGDVANFTPTFKASSKVAVEKSGNASWNNCFYNITLNVTITESSNKFVQLVGVEFFFAS